MNESATPQNVPSGTSIIAVVSVVLCAANLIDFVFYGQQLRNIAAAIGFALMAWGTYKNLQTTSSIGAILVVGAIASKYLL